MKFKNIIVISFITLFFNCSSNESKENNKTFEKNPKHTKIQINPTKAKEILLSELADSIVIIKLENTPEAMLGEVEKMEISNNLMFFMDRFSGTITCFDINGKFKYKIKKRGRGPEEYIDLEYFYIDTENQQIVISERSRKRLLNYNINTGKFISTFDVGFYIEELIKINDRIILSSDEDEKSKLMVYDSLLSKTYYSNFPYQEGKGDYIPPNIFSKYKNRVLYTHLFDDVVYEVGSNSLNKLVEIDFGKYKIKEEFFKGDMSKIVEKREEFIKKRYASLIHELHETKDFISFRYPFEENFYQVFVSKFNNKVLNIKRIKDEALSEDIPMPQAAYKNMFVSIIYSQETNKTLNKNTSQLVEAINSAKEDDNAIILLFSVKNN